MMRMALVHDWILGLRGGERVLETLCDIYPHATLYSLFYIPGRTSRKIDAMKIKTSFLNQLPGIARYYRYLLPLFPRAIERFNLADYDVTISCSHAVAKGAPVTPPAVHLCYCLTPMRYVWDMYAEYQGRHRVSVQARLGLRVFRRALQKWDRETSQRVTAFAGISRFVVERIRQCYGREAEIVYPPVNTHFFTLPERPTASESFFLVVSALVPYKRVDLVIEACNRLKLPLWIVGAGPLERYCRRIAGPSVRFLGRVSDADLRGLYQSATALIYAAKEEFGLVPVEAQACGTPVIAFGDGGVGETVCDGETGVLFHRQHSQDLIEAVATFRSRRWDPITIREHSLKFSSTQFCDRFARFVETHYPASRSRRS